MASQAQVREALKALRGLAEANRADFERTPELVGAYERALAAGRFRYVPDPDTCGRPDCWSSFRSLYTRYPFGPILGDCEDFAAAHAAYLTHMGQPMLIGLRPGKNWAHAVCASDPGEKQAVTKIFDPSVDFGMPPLPQYDGIHWLKVRPRE